MEERWTVRSDEAVTKINFSTNSHPVMEGTEKVTDPNNDVKLCETYS